MGKIKQGILGGFSGKVGGVIGSSWKGIAVIKSMPLSVANPRTASQIDRRSKLSNCSKFGSEILSEVIKPLWDRFSLRQSGYNAFTSANVDLFADEMPKPGYELVISQGKMDSTPIESAYYDPVSDKFVVKWLDDTGTGLKLATDTAFVVLSDLSSPGVAGFNTLAQRSSLKAEVELPASLDPLHNYHVYLAFRRQDGTVVSNTSNFIVVK